MDTKTLKLYRKRLVDQKTDITKGYDKTRSQGKQVDSDVSHDPVDKAANSYTKEFLFSLSNKERDEIQMIDDAIVRIDEKRFGACIVCGDQPAHLDKTGGYALNLCAIHAHQRQVDRRSMGSPWFQD